MQAEPGDKWKISNVMESFFLAMMEETLHRELEFYFLRAQVISFEKTLEHLEKIWGPLRTD